MVVTSQSLELCWLHLCHHHLHDTSNTVRSTLLALLPPYGLLQWACLSVRLFHVQNSPKIFNACCCGSVSIANILVLYRCYHVFQQWTLLTQVRCKLKLNSPVQVDRVWFLWMPCCLYNMSHVTDDRVLFNNVTTTTVLWPFNITDYPGNTVPEETFSHSHISWLSTILSQHPLSAMIHSIFTL